ncbi:heterokaryon incompatibility protein-domain-containing protein [Hyaloscypha sp. PMI_1271]|nr:heterokaryon incompatibility protein-domain-containing protein [Hyaloscypha sp. PMI_1271]
MATGDWLQDPNVRQCIENNAHTTLHVVTPPTMDREWPLCAKCNTFIQIVYQRSDQYVMRESGKKTWVIFDHHSYWSRDVRRRTSACVMCSFMFQEWRISNRQSLDYRYVLAFRPGQFEEFGILSWQVWLKKSRQNISLGIAGLSMLELDGNESRILESSSTKLTLLGSKSHPLRTTRWSEPSNPLINDALGGPVVFTFRPLLYCLKYHPSCKRQHRPRLPSRVIDVGQYNEPKDRVKLYETRGECAPYITLSHRWGGQIPSRLLKTNLANYLIRLDLSKLPRTFVEAIELAQTLSIRYLWIDALCIVQDDQEEWQIEALRMAEIYSNCLFNVCAAESTDSQSGLLGKEYFVWFNMHATEMSENIESKAWGLTAARNLTGVVKTGRNSLDTRGWTLQERLLSPANLHFLHGGMVWECRSGCFDNHGNFQLPHNILKCLQQGRKAVDDLPPNDRLLIWARLVENYSSRALTRSSDKLIALAGLARLIQGNYPSRYLAGLWEDDLPGALLWHKASDWLKRPNKYRAPSWTWAALDGAIHYPIHRDNILFSDPAVALKVLAARLEEKTIGSFGDVSEGYLIVEGILHELSDEQISELQQNFDVDEAPVRCWALRVGRLGWRNFEVEHQEEDHTLPTWFLLLGSGRRSLEYKRVGILKCCENVLIPRQSLLPPQSNRQRIKLV